MLKDYLPFTAIRNLPITHFIKIRIATQPCGILQCKRYTLHIKPQVCDNLGGKISVRMYICGGFGTAFSYALMGQRIFRFSNVKLFTKMYNIWPLPPESKCVSRMNSFWISFFLFLYHLADSAVHFLFLNFSNPLIVFTSHLTIILQFISFFYSNFLTFITFFTHSHLNYNFYSNYPFRILLEHIKGRGSIKVLQLEWHWGWSGTQKLSEVSWITFRQ